MPSNISSLAVVIPAAGVGKRMKANCPKQYLTINDKTILEHTVERLLAHPRVELVVLALGENDAYFAETSLVSHPKIKTVVGGNERVDSVLAGLKSDYVEPFEWVMVHDAARPCVTLQDIDLLINHCEQHQQGGLLASRVRDTMKQENASTQAKATVPIIEKNIERTIERTIDRTSLWHAYTPQMYRTKELIAAIEQGLENGVAITDESSAIEAFGLPSHLVEGRSDNLKVTQSDDLALAHFILNQQINKQEK